MVLLTILCDGSLERADDCIDRESLMHCYGMQGTMAWGSVRGQIQRQVEIVFWHMIEASDIRNRHPGADGMDILGSYQRSLLLEALQCSQRDVCGKACVEQCE